MSEKIKVSPIEPRYVVRAIAQPGKDIDNFDLQFLIQIGDTYYDLCPNKIKIEVPTCDKLVMNAEIDLHDMIIDMPATMVDEEDIQTKARFRLVAQHDHPGQHAINSSSAVTEVTADGKSIYAKSALLEADGETNGNKLTVHTIVHPKERRGEMVECTCGNKHSRDFLKMKSIPCFNCGTLVKATIMPDEEVLELIIQKRAKEKQASRDQDEADLKSGKITKEELRERNSYFAVDADVDLTQNDF